jgi:uncharacterized membrane protein
VLFHLVFPALARRSAQQEPRQLMKDLTHHRVLFIDALRGFALLLMVLNHTAIHLLDQTLDPGRHYLVYLSVSLSAPLFLFLVGFSLSLSFYRTRAACADNKPRHFRKYVKRGLALLMAGYVLNMLIAPHEPFYSGGILQTIGISIILLAPLLPWLPLRIFRDGLLLTALALYLVFVHAHPGIAAWSDRHPVMTHLFFEGFPPWPWISMVLIGLVLGYKWIETENQTDNVRSYLTKIRTVGIVCLLVYFGLNATQGNIINFNIFRDYIINGHWLPGGITMFWILGMVFTGFAMMYWLFENQVRHLEWLTAVGQSAFLLYVIHLLIIAGIADRHFGWRIHQWWLFSAFNLLLMLTLVVVSARYKLIVRQFRNSTP